MKKYKLFIFIIAILAISTSNYSQDYHVRIGIIGNSITQGTGLASPSTQSYPAQLQPILDAIYGDTCIVMNFGITTTTMLKKGDVSYWESSQFKDYMDYAPEVCIILLGTNDTKPQNWDVYGDEFIDDYMSMIDTIKTRNPQTKFMVCYPPPAFAVVYDIRNTIIVNGIIPGVDSILAKTDAELIDFYSTLIDSVNLFPDKIHPNIAGAGVMAGIIRDRIIETDIIHKADTGYTFVTSFNTETTPLALNDSTLLSWTSINADSVFLNGLKVASNGSMKISPPATTTYTLLAIGALSKDSLKLIQEVYVPVLSKLKLSYGNLMVNEGDTIFYQVIYYDQANRKITDEHYAVQWSVVNGDSYLFNETDTSVYFVAGSAIDTTKLIVEFGSISDLSIIRIKTVSSINSPLVEKKVTVFPNPCDDVINLMIETDEATELSWKIYDLKGVLYINETLNLTRSGQQTISLKTDNLPVGAYILKLKYSGEYYTDKIFIQRD